MKHDCLLPIRLPATLAAALAKTAKIEAQRDGQKPNLSETTRRAIASYIQKIEEAHYES